MYRCILGKNENYSFHRQLYPNSLWQNSEGKKRLEFGGGSWFSEKEAKFVCRFSGMCFTYDTSVFCRRYCQQLKRNFYKLVLTVFFFSFSFKGVSVCLMELNRKQKFHSKGGGGMKGCGIQRPWEVEHFRMEWGL